MRSGQLPKLALMACAIGGLLFVGITLRGCMTEHSRSARQGDIAFDVSPDGRTLVFAGFGQGRQDLYLFDVESRAVTRLTSSDDYETCPSFSRDGKRLVFARGTPGIRADQLCVMDLATRETVQLTDADENVSNPVFLPDGERILCTVENQYRWGGLQPNWDEGGELRIVDTDTRSQMPLKTPGKPVFKPRISADGKWMVWIQYRAPSQGAYLAPLANPSKASNIASSASSVAFDTKGARLAMSAGTYLPDHKVYITDRLGRNPRLISGASERCSDPVFSPDGKYVYFLAEGWIRDANDRPTKSLMRARTAGGEVTELASYNVLANPNAH